jgi:hypothetical protein
MTGKRRIRLTYANTVASLALFAALGGSSYAAISVTGKQVRDGSLSGRDVHNRSLTGQDVRDRSLLARDFKHGQLPAGPKGDTGDTGATGPQGPQGDKGDPGVSPATLWAVVSESSALVRSKGGARVNRVFAGLYEVTFPGQDLRNCATIASISATQVQNNLQSGEAAAKPSPDVADQVRVATRTSGGTFADKPFQVAVFC